MLLMRMRGVVTLSTSHVVHIYRRTAVPQSTDVIIITSDKISLIAKKKERNRNSKGENFVITDIQSTCDRCFKVLIAEHFEAKASHFRRACEKNFPYTAEHFHGDILVLFNCVCDTDGDVGEYAANLRRETSY